MDKGKVIVGEAEVKIDDRRTELVDKVNFDKETDNKIIGKKKINLVDTLALNDIIKEINIKESNAEEKRSEISGKFYDKSTASIEKGMSNIEKIESKVRELINRENEDFFDVDKKIINRTEIANKFKVDKNSIKHDDELKKSSKDVEINLVNTIALDGVIKSINSFDEKQKRSEISEKISNNLDKIEKALLKLELKNKEDLDSRVDEKVSLKDAYIEENNEIDDKIQENVEKLSIAMIILIVVVCSIVGSIIGYLLYKIAMNNSVMAILFRYLI